MARNMKDKETEPTNGLTRLRERLTKVSKYPSFPAYLRKDFDAFTDAISMGGPTKWDEIASWAMEEGYTGGKTIQAATAKRSYEREKQRRDALVKSPRTVPTPTPAVAQERLNASDPPRADPGKTPAKSRTAIELEKLFEGSARKISKPIR